MPRWAQSIRFRLAIAYASAVFATGAVLVAGLYAWQVNRLTSTITIRTDRVGVYVDPDTGQQVVVLGPRQQLQLMLEQQRREVYLRSLDELRRSSLIGLGLMSVVAFGSGWVLSGWALRPIGRMAATARQISDTELSQRIALVGPQDELKDLADTFDEMLDRLQASFEGQRQFVQDASHELRNPLAVAQTNLELVLSDPEASAEELRRAALIAHQSTDRVNHIVEDLLAQARNAVPQVASGPVDLVALADEVAAEMQAQAARRGIRIEVASPAPAVLSTVPPSSPFGSPVAVAVPGLAGPPLAAPGIPGGSPVLEGPSPAGPPIRNGGGGAGPNGLAHGATGNGNSNGAGHGHGLGHGAEVGPPGGVVVHADGAALRRAVSNLVANAVRLAPAGSTITITPGHHDHWATISVTDEGPGIAPEDQARVFERFWRGRDAGKGLGLGLSIVRQVAQRHGGTVDLVSEPGRGSTFTIALPLPVGRPAAP